ncbi:MAG: hypothetical protein ACFFG0_23835 [Candidatus Thorarchaeota archaeon]
MNIVDGGFQTGKLTEVYGLFKLGKTALAHTIAVTSQLPVKNGGLNTSVAYIDSENTFSKEKIKRIARRFGLNPNETLSRIYHAKFLSLSPLFKLLLLESRKPKGTCHFFTVYFTILHYHPQKRLRIKSLLFLVYFLILTRF